MHCLLCSIYIVYWHSLGVATQYYMMSPLEVLVMDVVSNFIIPL